MGVDEKNLKKLIYLLLLLILAMMMIVFSSCSDEYNRGWSWGVVTDDGEWETAKLIWDNHEMRIDDILLTPPHLRCKEKHYHDPYTKIEYCLPEGFTNMENLHLYRVVK